MEAQPEMKSIRDSMSEQVHIIMPSHVNSSNALFGGLLMEWIDVVAGVVSSRHSSCITCTAAVERLEFLAPAYIGDIVALKGRIVFAGHTSMVVCVDTYVERHPNHSQKLHVNRALLTMVAVDDNGKPCAVPGIKLETNEDQELWNEAKLRRDLRKSIVKTL